MSATLRKGWCPGALRPMESGDGLIVRLRISGGTLTPQRAHALANCAEDYGNGRIDLSARANLQLRGVRRESLAPLQIALDGLGLLDEDPDAEAVRNILASPLAGFDPAAVLDIEPHIHALDARLRADERLRSLPGKFLFAIDDGGCLPLPFDKADVAFVATGAENPRFSVYLGGWHAGACASADLVETAAQLAYGFLALRRDEPRMADLVRRTGSETLAALAKLDPAPEPASRRAPSCVLGAHALGAHESLGVGVAFGQFDSLLLRRLAEAADAANGILRLSPWRAVFIIAEHLDPSLAARLDEADFILEDRAPIRSVAACSGKPACFSARTAAPDDAMQLAPLAQGLAAEGIALHVSGCEKGCAHPAKAPVTLVGADEAYDLIVDGRAEDEPLLRHLSLAEAEAMLRQFADMSAADRAGFVRRLCEAAP